MVAGIDVLVDASDLRAARLLITAYNASSRRLSRRSVQHGFALRSAVDVKRIRRAEPVVLQLPLDCLPVHVVQTRRTLCHPAIQHREARDEDFSQNDAPSEWLPATSQTVLFVFYSDRTDLHSFVAGPRNPSVNSEKRIDVDKPRSERPSRN